jgi:hypothetical protein
MMRKTSRLPPLPHRSPVAPAPHLPVHPLFAVRRRAEGLGDGGPVPIGVAAVAALGGAGAAPDGRRPLGPALAPIHVRQAGSDAAVEQPSELQLEAGARERRGSWPARLRLVWGADGRAVAVPAEAASHTTAFAPAAAAGLAVDSRPLGLADGRGVRALRRAVPERAGLAAGGVVAPLASLPRALLRDVWAAGLLDELAGAATARVLLAASCLASRALPAAASGLPSRVVPAAYRFTCRALLAVPALLLHATL